MKTTGNTILITGGGSGIGRGLAEAFHKLDNTVIIAGRRENVLRETAQANPGMEYITLDTADSKSIAKATADLKERFPKLNVLINNAGIARPENLLDASSDFDAVEQMVATNLIAPLRLTAALLPQLEAQDAAVVMTVTSGLAFAPLAMMPTYCATKAAIHSWTESLRFQLRQTKVEVLELIPPYVQTELGGDRQLTDPRAMPLDEFISEVMEILKTQPEAKEINVERVQAMRYAAEGGQKKYQEFVNGFNEQMMAASH
ncbi:SDR family oxidoreductase [Granulicella arctica]|uniref:SDR family oxidoreductase n=1 Tax=Granulicella arctica TaxID=940613 RepID=UPI0021E0EF14|nr:SDR family NAD(P)-dependent oxidoreductase [Granulicella arctica]